MTRLLATISLIATAIFVLAILILHFLPTGVDPLVSGISFYALTRYGYLLQPGDLFGERVGNGAQLVGQIKGAIITIQRLQDTGGNGGFIG